MYGNVGGMWREVVGEPQNEDSYPVLQSQPSSRLSISMINFSDVVDHRTLIFDKPDPNPTRSFLSGGKQPPGAKRYRDQR